jgi:hypothetical protein
LTVAKWTGVLGVLGSTAAAAMILLSFQASSSSFAVVSLDQWDSSAHAYESRTFLCFDGNVVVGGNARGGTMVGGACPASDQARSIAVVTRESDAYLRAGVLLTILSAVVQTVAVWPHARNSEES